MHKQEVLAYGAPSGLFQGYFSSMCALLGSMTMSFLVRANICKTPRIVQVRVLESE